MKTVTQDCGACHNMLAVDEANPKILTDLGGGADRRHQYQLSAISFQQNRSSVAAASNSTGDKERSPVLQVGFPITTVALFHPTIPGRNWVGKPKQPISYL